MSSSFVQATRERAKLKLCLAGPSGSGKSYTALILAHAMQAAGLGKRIAVIESEAGKINKYAGYTVHGQKWDFAVCVLEDFNPSKYVEKLEEAHRAGFDIVIIDSISHEWQGKGGALETVDKTGGANKFTSGWKVVTPLHNTFVDTVLRLPVHVIATCRLKMGYVVEDQEKNGRTIQVPKKIGMEPIQRNGIEYEFEIFATLDTSHIIRVEKTICPMLDGKTEVSPGPGFFAPLFSWLGEGVEVKASDYRSSLVPQEKLAALMTQLRDIGANAVAEKDWILKKFGVEEWSHLSPEQFTKYQERVQLLAYSAAQSAEKLQQPAETTTTTPTPAPASAPANGTPAAATITAAPTNGHATIHPILDKPLPAQAPATYGITTYDRCKTLFEELRVAKHLDVEGGQTLFKELLKMFNATSAKELAETQLMEIEQKLMKSLRKVRVETGTEAALTF